MITAATIDDLSDVVPPLLLEAIALSKKLDAAFFAKYRWKPLPSALVLRYTSVNGALQTSAGQLGQRVTRPLVDELKDLVYYRAVPALQAGEHVGTAAVSEGLILTGADSLPQVTGSALEAAIDDLAAEGKVRHIRSTLAVLSSGWRYEYRRERAGNNITIDVYEPGDDWTTPEIALLAALDAKILTRS